MADTSFCLLMKLNPAEDGLQTRVPLQMIDEYVGDFPHAQFAPVDAAAPEVQVKVVYEWWKISQSQYHYRPIGIVELGSLD